MDVTQKIYIKLKKILKRLQNLKVIESFFLKINFCAIENNNKVNLLEIDSILKKCLKKIGAKHKRAEIRKVITKLVRNKNLKDGVPSENEDENTFNNFSNKNSQSPNKILNFNFNTSKNTQLIKKTKGKIINYNKKSKTFQKYFCSLCKKVFYNFLKWKHHDVEHLQNSFYTIENCHKIFTLNEDTEKYESQNFNPNKNKVYSLKIIQSNQKIQNVKEILLLENKNNLEKIVDIKVLNNQKPSAIKKKNPETFTCVCGKVFKFLKSLKKHESLKHSVRSIIYPCMVCEKSFVEKGKLNRHMLSHKSNQFQCPQCLKLFARSDALKRHLSITHNLEKKWSCSFCKKEFSLKYNRDVHEENLHKNLNEWFQCEHCGGKFKNKLTLKSHLKIHSEKQITCSLCSKNFTRKIHYKNHMKNKHFGISLYQNLLDSVAKEDGF